MKIIKRLSIIVTIVVKYKIIKPLVFITTMLTMSDNRGCKIIRCTHEYYRNCQSLSLLSFNKKVQSPLFF